MLNMKTWRPRQFRLIFHSHGVVILFNILATVSVNLQIIKQFIIFLSFSLTFQDKMPVSAVIQADNYL